MNQPSRRTFLAGAGGGAAALALAACTSTPPNSAPGEGNTSAAAANRSGAMTNYGVGTQFKASTPLKFSIMILSNPVYPYNANWLFFTQLKKMTNVSFNPTVVPFADYNTKVQTLIAAGQQPYIIPKTYPGQEDAFVAGGQILPVSDYVHLMPNYQAKVAAWNLDGDLNTIRQADGKYYLLPGLHQSVPSDYTMGVRTDLMAKYNIATPSTLAQVEGMLMTLKNENPGHYPFSDRWNQPTPGGAFLQMVGNAYGTMAGWNYQSFNQGAVYDYGSKQWVFAASMPQYQQMVTLLNGWYNKGLIDPESFTQPDTQALAKFTTGKSLAIMENAQYVVTDQKALKPGWTVGKVPVPIGPTGATVYGSRLDGGLMISAKAAQDPHFVAMMEFIDWLWYSDAGMLFARWGVEGTTYTGSVADGTFALLPNDDWAGLHPNAKIEINATYGFYNGVFSVGGSTQLMQTQYPPAELAFQKIMDPRTPRPLNPPAPLTTLQSQQATTTGTTLMDYVQGQTISFITGKRPMSQWSQFQGELQGKGSASFLNIYSQAYNTYKAAHPTTS
ncbi:MAG TPA: extracellular solute-binding protein [Chloroflexota bacterium]|nr:extracellular solute-binding protein [Chloroflexota bacterium]